MKIKTKISFLLLGAAISVSSSFLTISLTDADVQNHTRFTLTDTDIRYYSTLYSGKGGLFDRLNIIKSREKLLKETNLRSFRPSIGIIDLNNADFMDGMNLPGIETGEFPLTDNIEGGQHATTIASMFGTRSGINPFANIYSAVLPGSVNRSLNSMRRYWRELFQYFNDNNVSVVNMSLGLSFFDMRRLLMVVINRIDNKTFREALGRARFNDQQAGRSIRFRDINSQERFSRSFINAFWNQTTQRFDIERFLQGNSQIFRGSEAAVEKFKLDFQKGMAETIKSQYDYLTSINQLYSEQSRVIDNILLEYNIKFLVSGGNDQAKFDSFSFYVDKLKSVDPNLSNLDLSLLSGWVPDPLKKARNIIYVGSVDINTNLSENYSVVGTQYHEDYPFVSTYTGFSTATNPNRNLSAQVNPYIRSFNNDRFDASSTRDFFSGFEGTSYSSGILAGIISLAEYEIGRKLTTSEVKAALALSSNKSAAIENIFSLKDNPTYEYTTTSRARNRTGYGIPDYEKFVKALLNKDNIKTVKITDITAGQANNIFKGIKLGVGETLKALINFDYVPNSIHDSNGIGLNWNTEANKNRFLEWINRFDLEALDNENQLFKSTSSKRAYANTRELTFKNYAFEDVNIDLNLYTKKFSEDQSQTRSGNITVTWEIVK